MKKWLCGLLGLSLLLLPATAGRAQTSGIEFHGLFGFGFNGKTGDLGDQDVDNGWGAGASFVFALHPNIRLDVGGDWLRTQSKDLFDDCNITLIPVEAALRLGADLDTVFVYAGGGAGYSFNDFDPTAAVKSWWGRVELKDSMIYFALAGVELGLSESVALRAEFRYNWLNPDLKFPDWAPPNTTDIKLDHMQLRAGLAFYM